MAGGGLVQGAVVKTGRHGPVEAVHESQQVEFRRPFDVLGLYPHPILEERFFSVDVGEAVDFHAGVAALPIQAVESAGAMIFQASGKNTDAAGEKRGGDGVALEAAE